MFELENKFWNFIIKYKELLFIWIISIAAIFIRLDGISFVSGDMLEFLIPWYEKFKQSGFSTLGHPDIDYNILYQTIISIMAYFKMPIISIKLLSVAFDFVLAVSAAVLINYLTNKKSHSFDWCMGYAAIILLPTVILNSAFWGQCDSIYTAFLVLTILFLLKEKFVHSFIFYGIALAFKLQAVFILPFLICYYLYKRKFSFLMFFVSVFTFWVSGAAAFLFGKNLLLPFKIYMYQTNIYKDMTLNFPNFWIFIGNKFFFLKTFGIILSFCLCAIMLYFIIIRKKKFETNEQILNTLCWFIWTCLIFLPAMHERYAYPLDIFLIILCFTNIKYIKYAFISVFISLITSGIFLFGNDFLIFIPILAIIYLFAYIHYTYTILKIDSEEQL